jgi:hypothetical protein
MTKAEFEKEYKRAEYRYAEMKQYKKLYDNAEELKYKLKLIQDMQSIHHIDIYRNSNNLMEFYDLTDAAQVAIKTVIENDLEERLSKTNEKIKEIDLRSDFSGNIS